MDRCPPIASHPHHQQMHHLHQQHHLQQHHVLHEPHNQQHFVHNDIPQQHPHLQVQPVCDQANAVNETSSKKKNLRIPKEWKLKYGRNAHSSNGAFDEDAETRLIKALHHVQTTGQNITEAAKRFGVPRSTLNERLKRDDPFAKRVRGTHPTLTQKEEEVMCKWLTTAYRRGHAITPKRFATTVKELLDGSGRINIFANDNRPTSGWVKTFRRRHPTIKFIKHDKWNDPKNVQGKSIGWFDDLLEHLNDEKTDPMHLLEKPNDNRVFCLAEYGIGINYDGNLLDTIIRSNNQDNSLKFISILCCINAASCFLPPFLLYPDHRPNFQPISNQIDLTSFNAGVKTKTWLTDETLCMWLRTFVDYLDYNKISRPVLLIVSGDYALATLPLCELCAQAGIILHIVPKMATDFIHPVDVAIYEHFNSAYKECYNRYVHSFLAITLGTLPLVIVEAWNKIKNPEFAKIGFHASGFVTFDQYSNRQEKESNGSENYCQQTTSNRPINEKLIRDPTTAVYSSANQSTDKINFVQTSSQYFHSNKKEVTQENLNHQNSKNNNMSDIQQSDSSSFIKFEISATSSGEQTCYVRGLCSALETVVSFVPGPVRAIYQEWIEKGIDSETKDPVFLVWRRIDNMIKDAKT